MPPSELPIRRAPAASHRLTQALLLAALLVTGAPSAHAADEVARAEALLAQGNGAAAWSLLEPLEEANAGDPAFDYLLGAAAIDAGEPGRAVFALERVLALEPDNALARAEIARAYFLLSEFDNARAEFEAARNASSLPREALPTIEEFITRIDRQGGGERFAVHGYVTIGGGYDSNINSATDASQIVTANNLILTLNNAAQSQASMYTLTAGGVNVSARLSERWTAIGGSRAFWRQVDNSFGTQNVYLYAGVAHETGRHRLAVAAQGEIFRVDVDPLRNSYGGLAQWTFTVDDYNRITGALQLNELKYPDAPARNATRVVASGGYTRILRSARQPTLSVGVYRGVEDENDNAFQQFGHDLFGLRFSSTVAVTERSRAFAAVNYERRVYDGPSFLSVAAREDRQLSLNAGLTYRPDNAWEIRPNMSYTNNDSTLTLNAFSRVTGGIDASWRF